MWVASLGPMRGFEMVRDDNSGLHGQSHCLLRSEIPAASVCNGRVSESAECGSLGNSGATDVLVDQFVRIKRS
jgi:hypothetical protein